LLGITVDAPAARPIPPEPAAPDRSPERPVDTREAPGRAAEQRETATTPPDRPLVHRTSFHGTGALAFSTKGEYGVRLMVQLGRHVGTGPASLTEIAAEEDLPRPYLEQLAMVLRDAGLVTSTRGAHGGYELSRPAAEISMADILRALEGPIAPMICVTDDPAHIACDRTARCTVNLLWLRIRDAIAGTLDSMTLADLVPQRQPLVAELIPAETLTAAVVARTARPSAVTRPPTSN
jgi:Rrf2 family transcriptional regulator, cysteine metabolism repressor